MGREVKPGEPIKGKSAEIIIIDDLVPSWTWMDAFGYPASPKGRPYVPVKSGRLRIWNPESECVTWLHWPTTQLAKRHEPSMAPAVNPERRHAAYQQQEILTQMFPRCKTNRGRLKRLAMEVRRKKARTA